MTTAQRQMAIAVRDLLGAHPAVADGRISLQRRRPMPQAVDQQLFVYLEDSTGQHVSASTEWETRVFVDCLARDSRTTGVPAEQAADELAQEVHARLMGSANLNGAALSLMCHLQWAEEEAETTVASTKVLCIVRHRTPRNSLS